MFITLCRVRLEKTGYCVANAGLGLAGLGPPVGFVIEKKYTLFGSNKTGYNLIIYHFNIRGKQSIMRCYYTLLHTKELLVLPYQWHVCFLTSLVWLSVEHRICIWQADSTNIKIRISKDVSIWYSVIKLRNKDDNIHKLLRTKTRFEIRAKLSEQCVGRV